MESERAQTTLDFAIGISIFLSVLLFVFSFVPGLLQPFSDTGGEDPVLSERLGNRLTEGMLGDPAEPYVLDRYCAVEFFNESRYANNRGPPAACRYDGGDLRDRLDVKGYKRVNVTLAGNVTAAVAGSTSLCWDADAHALNETGSGDCGDSDDVALRVGDSPPSDNDATVTARRVVSLHGEDVTMTVVVW